MNKNWIAYVIATVWLVNGLFCKVLNLVPRHQTIVARIMGPEYASQITKLIGFGEIIMAAWIISGYKSRINAITQIAVIGSMNVLEAILAPDLLLWGYLNGVFALLFILLIWYDEFSYHQTSPRS